MFNATSDDPHRSIETLVRYLADRRPKLGAALQKVGITPESQSYQTSPLSEASIDELFSLPNAPLAALTPEQLLRFAQIVDTALYKSYLIIRPALLGSLCRVANWCEVTEVEDDLRARKVRLLCLCSTQLFTLFDAEICRVEGLVPRQEDAFQGSRLTEGVCPFVWFRVFVILSNSVG
jgi:hypothetical protein